MSSCDVAIVTGAGSGLGQAVALSLAEMHLRVIAVGRRLDPLLETASKSRGKIEPVAADVSTASGRSRICSALRPPDRVRFLVHAAGIHAVEPLASITAESWRRVLDTNVDARLFLTLDLLPWLRSESRVLFVGSNSATRPRQSATAYCVSQAASRMLQQCLMVELGPRGIAVGSALPSPVDTPMIAAQIAADPALYPDAEEYRRLRDAGKLIDPRVVATFYRWLLTKTSAEAFSVGQWNVRDEGHHAQWLQGKDLYARASDRD